MDPLHLIEPESKPASCKQPNPNLPQSYSYSVAEAVIYFQEQGFRIAPRTISWHCQTNLLDCEKFVHGNVQKWKITKESIDDRIKALKREGFRVASNSEQMPASIPASNNEQQLAVASELSAETIKILTDELHEKNKQIDEFQSIIHDHNQQLENLNKTIQLSNQTIQQLNGILALPQVKDVMQPMHEQQRDREEAHEASATPAPDYSDISSVISPSKHGLYHQNHDLESGDINLNNKF